MSKLVGIDFGACNIKAASWKGKKARVVQLTQDVDKNYIPNIVLYDMTRDGKLEKKIGDPAKDEQDPQNSVEYVKRKLELPKWSKNIPNLNREVSAEEATADIFSGIAQRLTQKLNCETKDLSAAITIPVCSSALQRSRIYKAAQKAGITVEAIVTEPFAAMFAVEELFEGDEDKNALIFDFGGSTLDLSLISVENDNNIRIEELASAGLAFGGIDIDEAIYSEIIFSKYASEIAEIKANDATIDKAKTTHELQRLVTTLKEKLFEEDNESSKQSRVFYGSSKYYEFELTRQEMIALFERHNLKGKIFGLLDELFGQTYLNKDEITHIKAIGGSSRIKYTLDLLTEYFGADIFDSDDYEWDENAIEDVAVGAAHYLGVKTESANEIEIVSKIPFSLGIARGKRFKKYIECCPPYGQPSKSIPLTWDELKGTDYKVNVYQSFADSENVEIEGSNGAVYVGSVTVDPNLYEAKDDGIKLEMILKDSDTLQMVFSEMKDSGFEEVERHTINMKEM